MTGPPSVPNAQREGSKLIEVLQVFRTVVTISGGRLNLLLVHRTA
jgi:hypothetical protein